MSSSHVVDVDAASFAAEVIEESRQRPVLVDFWAEWCGPCRMLGPVLERVADSYAGAFRVAKVDTDANQQLAAQFQIRGIPACKLFVDGKLVDEFTGALPEPAVREFVGRHVKSELDAALERIAADRAGSVEAIDGLLADHADDPRVLLEAAHVALAAGDPDLASERAKKISMAADQHDAAQALLGLAELSRVAATDAADPYTTGARHAVAGRYQQALDDFLSIARTEPKAREAMVVIFSLCDADLARTYRRKLAIAT